MVAGTIKTLNLIKEIGIGVLYGKVTISSLSVKNQ
jgi:hypothetical protein